MAEEGERWVPLATARGRSLEPPSAGSPFRPLPGQAPRGPPPLPRLTRRSVRLLNSILPSLGWWRRLGNLTFYTVWSILPLLCTNDRETYMQFFLDAMVAVVGPLFLFLILVASVIAGCQFILAPFCRSKNWNQFCICSLVISLDITVATNLLQNLLECVQG
jgi:hypothetical protein